MKYLVFDEKDNPVACLLFGSAAWKTLPRDNFIGWDEAMRKANLHLLTNNMRFLILPWVKVPHLASHILGKVARRISSDWIKRYHHPIYMLEAFVEKERFRGTFYQAANWIYVGESKGRSRNDRYKTLKVPIKDIYLYPLVKRFREKKECLTCPLAVPNPIKDCRYLKNECGYSTHVSIKAHPRLICEIPRCSDRWKKIRNLRSASERSNGTCKSSDLDILESPCIYGLSMASIEATMACITTLLKRMMRFVIGITLNPMRYLKTSR